MLFDPKTRQQQVDTALTEAKKVLAEWEHSDANSIPKVNLIKEYGQEPPGFTD
jgi:chaperonin cofactor prefoldin